MKTCVKCQQTFLVSDEDRAFYDKISPVIAGKKFSISEPTFCPDCRRQRRLSFRNERSLYKRICGFSKKNIISTFSQDKPYQVYEREIWWSDVWDPLEYAQEISSDKKVIETLESLLRSVPIPNLFIDGTNVNCDYTNQAGDNKNCYLIFNAGFNEDVLYSRGITKCRDSMELYFGQNDELCYECVNCHNSYNLSFSQNSTGCRDSSFLFDCIGCSNCFGCSNLRQKKYCFFNVQYTQEEYEKKIKDISMSSYKNWKYYQQEFQKICENAIHKSDRNINTQECVGDYIFNSKNCSYSFEMDSCEDCKYSNAVKYSKDCQDIFGSGYHSELLYETTGVGGSSQHALFSWNSYGCSNLYYSVNCHACQDCFGCFSLRNKKYCIFNKQYSKEEYEALLPGVIEQMKAEGQWGEFFPSSFSPFCYNETLAQEYYPKTKQEVLHEGLKWYEEMGDSQFSGTGYQIPDDTQDAPDNICQEILVCEKTGKPFKILKQELEFYRKQQLPLPHLCPDERHLNRVTLRNPWRLWERYCLKCSKTIHTTYAPDRPEKVYCEECYLKEVY